MVKLKLEILLDSVIIIDHFNGIKASTEFLLDVEGRSGISVITRAEVLTGFSTRQLSKACSFLDMFPTIALTKEHADLAAELRRKNRWKLPDAFQAAIAIDAKILLATRNTKDFSKTKHPFVLVPYRI